MSKVPSLAVGSRPSGVVGLLELGAKELLDQTFRRVACYAPRLTSLKIKGLAIPLPGVIEGNASAAAEIYAGCFKLDGHVVERVDFPVTVHKAPSLGWYDEFHSFEWLIDLKACGRDLSRAKARAMVRDWIKHQSTHGARAWHSKLMSRRLINWVRFAPFLMTGASESFVKSFYENIARHVRRLMRGMSGLSSGEARLNCAIALCYASVGFSGLKTIRAISFHRLSNEIDQQILPDGGHVSRNPVNLVKLLLDLLPLRLALESQRQPVQDELNAALERMLPMVRFFCHGDKALSTFNGADDLMAGITSKVLASDNVGGKPLVHALHSGYARLARGASTVLVDIGSPPAPGRNPKAGSGPLAFEFSDGAERIVVNCGHSRKSDHGWIHAARLTAAHSTVGLNEQSAGRIIDNGLVNKVFGAPVVLGPIEIGAEIEETETGVFIDGRHDGYLKRYGIQHQRNLFLSQNGLDLRGEDRFRLDLERAGGFDNTPFEIRFHLHPKVKATVARDGGSVMLMLANKIGWRFSARGGQLRLDDSIYLPGASGSRRTKQIVISGVIGRPDRVIWAFKRIAKRNVATDNKSADAQSPELPL